MSESAKVFLEKTQVGGQTKIAIEVTNVKENLQNESIKIPIPIASQSQQNSTTPQTRFKDLKRINHVITIEGKLYNQLTWVKNSGTLDDENERQLITASQAKNALIYYILYTFGDIKLYWRGAAASNANPSSSLSNLMDGTDTDRSTTVVFDKIEFREIPLQRNDFLYKLLNGFDFNETNTKSYNIILTLTKGVSF